MIVGMGCGTEFYLASISLAFFVSILLYLLYATDYGLKQKLESVMRVTYKVGDGTIEKVEGELGKSFREFKLINRILDFGEDEETNVYLIRPRSNSSIEDIEKRLRKVDGVVNMSLYQSDQHAPF
jgi:hypothetical protein